MLSSAIMTTRPNAAVAKGMQVVMLSRSGAEAAAPFVEGDGRSGVVGLLTIGDEPGVLLWGHLDHVLRGSTRDESGWNGTTRFDPTPRIRSGGGGPRRQGMRGAPVGVATALSHAATSQGCPRRALPSRSFWLAGGDQGFVEGGGALVPPSDRKAQTLILYQLIINRGLEACVACSALNPVM